jgi:hypothetical protein
LTLQALAIKLFSKPHKFMPSLKILSEQLC